ncbi:Mycobacterium terramassiliense ORFan, partial [Mycobacterium terramassiliense]
VDHRLPIGRLEELGISLYDEAALAVLCRSCNARKGNRYTAEDEAAVLASVNAEPRKRAIG